jgi:hypothetical protein
VELCSLLQMTRVQFICLIILPLLGTPLRFRSAAMPAMYARCALQTMVDASFLPVAQIVARSSGG